MPPTFPFTDAGSPILQLWINFRRHIRAAAKLSPLSVSFTQTGMRKFGTWFQDSKCSSVNRATVKRPAVAPISKGDEGSLLQLCAWTASGIWNLTVVTRFTSTVDANNFVLVKRAYWQGSKAELAFKISFSLFTYSQRGLTLLASTTLLLYCFPVCVSNVPSNLRHCCINCVTALIFTHTKCVSGCSDFFFLL